MAAFSKLKGSYGVDTISLDELPIYTLPHLISVLCSPEPFCDALWEKKDDLLKTLSNTVSGRKITVNVSGRQPRFSRHDVSEGLRDVLSETIRIGPGGSMLVDTIMTRIREKINNIVTDRETIWNMYSRILSVKMESPNTKDELVWVADGDITYSSDCSRAWGKFGKKRFRWNYNLEIYVVGFRKSKLGFDPSQI